jgi:hypothetical protein
LIAEHVASSFLFSLSLIIHHGWDISLGAQNEYLKITKIYRLIILEVKFEFKLLSEQCSIWKLKENSFFTPFNLMERTWSSQFSGLQLHHFRHCLCHHTMHVLPCEFLYLPSISSPCCTKDSLYSRMTSSYLSTSAVTLIFNKFTFWGIKEDFSITFWRK